MAILSKRCKTGKFESCDSLSCSFTNKVFVRILLNVNLSFNQTLLTSVLYVRQLGWLNWFCQFLCEVLSSFNPKRFCYSYVRSCSLCEGKASLCRWLVSRKLCGFFMFSTGFTSLCVTSFFTNIVCVGVSTPPPPSKTPHPSQSFPFDVCDCMHICQHTWH